MHNAYLHHFISYMNYFHYSSPYILSKIRNHSMTDGVDEDQIGSVELCKMLQNNCRWYWGNGHVHPHIYVHVCLNFLFPEDDKGHKWRAGHALKEGAGQGMNWYAFRSFKINTRYCSKIMAYVHWFITQNDLQNMLNIK